MRTMRTGYVVDFFSRFRGWQQHEKILHSILYKKHYSTQHLVHAWEAGRGLKVFRHPKWYGLQNFAAYPCVTSTYTCVAKSTHAYEKVGSILRIDTQSVRINTQRYALPAKITVRSDTQRYAVMAIIRSCTQRYAVQKYNLYMMIK